MHLPNPIYDCFFSLGHLLITFAQNVMMLYAGRIFSGICQGTILRKVLKDTFLSNENKSSMLISF